MKLTPEIKSMRDSGMSYQQIADELGVAKSTVTRIFSPRKPSGAAAPVSAKPKPEAGRSLKDFAQKYDKDIIVPRRIKDALKTMPDWLYESEFVRHAGISQTDCSSFRDQFAEHVVVIKRDGRKVWAKTATVAEQLREMVA